MIKESSNTKEKLSPLLLAWWDHFGRHDLPWQINPNLYRVWISEIMLQQTQVKTVLKYYPRFIAAFPTVTSLASSSEDKVLHYWSGLGYYRRARNLFKAAKQVVNNFGGQVPEDFDELVSLPGIGRSTAGAILALTKGQRHPILDGNAKRVLARVFGIEGWLDSSAAQKKLWRIADECTLENRVSNYTQAIMDLGATICTRGTANCNACPVIRICKAYQTHRVENIPAPRPKKIKPQREVIMLLVVFKKGVLLEKRSSEGIWAGLWSFPELSKLEQLRDWSVKHIGHQSYSQELWPTISHSFSHFDLKIHPIELRLESSLNFQLEKTQWVWYKSSSPIDIGLAAPVTRLLKTLSDKQLKLGVH
ncbi:MAG: A/G-specific adenine glycosylase [Pseudomonadota bacterium]|nr:A/G-specific adenine glycosylase [Pseudomonadota bacterium]